MVSESASKMAQECWFEIKSDSRIVCKLCKGLLYTILMISSELAWVVLNSKSDIEIY